MYHKQFMISVAIQSLALASVGIISPGSITVVLLLLMSADGRRNGLGYTLGYVAMYTAIGVSAIGLGLGSAENMPTEQSLPISVALIILGILLLAFGLRSWRMPPSDGTHNSRLTAILNSITPLRSVGLGVLVAVGNLKNLALFLASLSILLVSELSIPTKLLILVPLVILFCISVAAPVVVAVAFPARADHYLTRMKQMIDRYSRPIAIWMPILFGALLLARGIRGLG